MKPAAFPSPVRRPQQVSAAKMPLFTGGLALLFFTLTLGLGGFAWWQHNRIQELEAMPAAKRPAVAAHKEPRATPAPRSTEEEAPPAPADPGRAAMAVGLNNLLANPQVQQFVDNLARNGVERAYAGLFEQLDLTPEQNEALRNLLTQRLTVGRDVLNTAVANGVENLDPQTSQAQYQQMVNEAQNQIDRSINSLLGDAGYQQYQEYNKTLPRNGLGRNTIGGS
jgi:hypothetical protein